MMKLSSLLSCKCPTFVNAVKSLGDFGGKIVDAINPVKWFVSTNILEMMFLFAEFFPFTESSCRIRHHN